MYTKQKLINSLNVVKQAALSGNIKETTAGICLNWSEEMYDEDLAYVLVENISPTWKQYSGNPAIPIEGYFSSNSLWCGEQLELRLSLINHILKFLAGVDQKWVDKLYSEHFDD